MAKYRRLPITSLVGQTVTRVAISYDHSGRFYKLYGMDGDGEKLLLLLSCDHSYDALGMTVSDGSAEAEAQGS